MQPGGASVGLEKGLQTLHGRALIAWARAAMPESLVQHYVSANRCVDIYGAYGTVVSDDPVFGGDPGPLAGVLAALRCMPTPWLYVVPADVPAPPRDVLSRLWRAVVASGPNASLAYAWSDGPQPLFMLVHARLADSLHEYLLSGQRRVQHWQRHHGYAVVFADASQAFFNINTPADLELAHRIVPVTSF